MNDKPKKYNYTVFIGRMTPFHKGHHQVVKEALEQSEKLIIVLGSDQAARSARNPFTTFERKEIIQAALTDEESERVIITAVPDYTYSLKRWQAAVQSAVSNVRPWSAGPEKIALIGHNKDHSSFYLKLFPQWDSIAVEHYKDIDATNIREYFYEYFENGDPHYKTPNLRAYPNINNDVDWIVNPDHYSEVYRQFKQFVTVDEDDINPILEYLMIKKYKKDWEGVPFPPVSYTSDAIVTLGGHILLIKRGKNPGKGLWALPGGFVNEYETAHDAVFRELDEETKIDVPLSVLKNSVDKHELYDDPYRDPRMRVITHAYHIKMENYSSRNDPEFIKLPKIKGSDDAKEAKWFTIDEVKRMRSKLYADHFDIIIDMLGI